MNIFILDHDPLICAQYHCDKHVNKMITEHLQMMSVALAHYGYNPAIKKDGITHYSTKAYKNHPCTLWVKESSGNFFWLYVMTRHLCGEFRQRYGKPHAGEKSLDSIAQQGDAEKLMNEDIYPHLGYTDPAQAMPDYCKVKGDAVSAYRSYYNAEKWSFASWARAYQGVPSWWAPNCYLNNSIASSATFLRNE